MLDYANAMVPAGSRRASGAESNWQEHLDGKSNYSPPIPPLAPAKFTGSLYIAEGGKVRPECTNFATSVQNATGTWTSERRPDRRRHHRRHARLHVLGRRTPSTRGVTTDPPNTCEGGVGVGATTFNIPIPMPALRQN